MARQNGNAPWPDVWSILDQVGFALQSFAQTMQHDREKLALGLPRISKGGASGPFDPTGEFKRSLKSKVEQARYASPLHLHVERVEEKFRVSAVAFVQPGLPDTNASRQFLKKCLDFLQEELTKRNGLGVPPWANSKPTVVLAPPASRVSVPETSLNELKLLLPQLPANQIILKLLELGEKGYKADWFMHAPKTNNGYSLAAGWIVADAPSGLANSTYVVAVVPPKGSKVARFERVLGRVPSPPQPPSNSARRGPPNRRR